MEEPKFSNPGQDQTEFDKAIARKMDELQEEFGPTKLVMLWGNEDGRMGIVANGEEAESTRLVVSVLIAHLGIDLDTPGQHIIRIDPEK